MNTVTLPALTGDSPLGILAAIGTARLLSIEMHGDVRLSWDDLRNTAQIHSDLGSVDAIVEILTQIVGRMGEDALLPNLDAGFPPPGAAPDGLRVPPATLGATILDLVREMSPDQTAEAYAWLASLVTDIAADAQGRGAISQFTAPTGKQSMATMLEKPLALVRKNPSYLRQALVGWRRVSGVTGESLDHRAIWGASEDGRGQGEMRGVPGATWLALMSFPVFRTTATAGGKPWSSGWHTVREGRRTYQELRLPLWRQPLGIAGITAVIEHPALAQIGVGPEDADADLALLGVFDVCRARRYLPPGGQSAGMLSPV